MLTGVWRACCSARELPHHGSIEVRLDSSSSIPLSRSIGVPAAGVQSGSTRPPPHRAFDTVETQFFKEGDELSTPPPVGNYWDEVVEVCAPNRRKHGLATWLALAAVALVVFAVLVF